MMNSLYLIVTSDLKEPDNFIRLSKSIDVNSNITILFVNQNADMRMNDFFKYSMCNAKEFLAGKVISLSKARNIALEHLYADEDIPSDSLVMFVDDDAWFDEKTINMLLSCEIGAKCLRTIDPQVNKAFNGRYKGEGEVKGWHVIHDICSICLVVPMSELIKKKPMFNEKLGLGAVVSQGEESLFIYDLYRNGMRIFYDINYIYHPYKISNNIKNYYSLSYFWAWGLSHVSIIFLWPCIKYLAKYSVGLLLSIKNCRYAKIFIGVWKGAFNGFRNSEHIEWEK